MVEAAIVVTWLAAAYRLWVSFTQPRTLWRTCFTVAMLSAAAALTLYRFRIAIDQATGVYNAAGLAAHLILTAGIGCLLIYLESLRRLHVSYTVVRFYLSLSAGVIAVTSIAWLVAPIHDQEVDDLLTLSASSAVVVYCVTFWLFIATSLALTARTCLARGRTFRRKDLARSVSLLLIGISALTGIPVTLIWTLSILVQHRGGDAGTLNAVGDALLPWPVLLDALGVLSLLAVPYASSLVRAARQWRQLRPLWSEMVSRYPDVHLPLDITGGPLTRTQTRLQRAIIETRDALRVAPVDATPASLTVEAVARSLRTSTTGTRTAAELLDRSDTREADVQQLIELARAFAKAGHVAS